ncbi:putative uncharacterized protein DDB_G0271606 [Benincasa hispida]|uniref:putative uncharacterized protein DDB_G0271606 n=1 Tax=Benincasa hispida TaxID=102211 RepID=UPI0019003143|nr:putative uncharacterized protein DDB_G0271606 [Benincasa hispida]
MASSQVEISSSSSPFGCVLRDHNRRREPNVAATHVARFRDNLKTLVMDRLNDCITITPNKNKNKNQNQNQNPNPVLPNFRVSKTNHNTTTNAAPRRANDSQRQTSINDPQTQTQTQTTSTPTPETGTNKNQTSKLGASSLVQIWEKRLNVSSSNVGLNANANASNTAVCSAKQETETEQEQACSVEVGDFEDERYDAGPGSEDGFADWHSSRTSSSSPPSSTQSQSSDAGERERVRVVDIIRRLTLTAAKPPHSSWVEDHNDHPNESSSSSHPTLILRDQVEPARCLSHILCSPRIRGRQAFADLLLQIERDRQRELDILVERRAVSKFSQRGRIQSLLRLKILKRGMALEDEQKRPQFVITPRENHRSSTIMHLREKFSGVGENGARSPIGEMLNNNDEDKNQSHTNAHTPPHATNTNEKEKDNDNEQVVGIHSNSINNDQILEGFKEEQIEEREREQEQEQKQEIEQEQEPKQEQEQGEEVDPPSSEGTWQDRPNLNLDSQDSINGWEAEDQSEAAEESYGADYVGTSYDWFSDISRPRSYWEDRRQSWYQQMLDSSSANDEIRQLIQRKTVSTFLSSDFRERMDKLMVTRLERQTQEEEEYDEVNEEDDDDRAEELWCFSEGRTQSKSSDNGEEEEDERSLISAQYHEASDYLDQSTSPLQLASPSILSSWSYQLDNEMGEDSNRGASTSSPQPFQPQFSSNNQQGSSLVSTTHHPSIEMELIYDLRGHMEQLYQEMSELRKSIKCCMDMQLMLQHSIKRHEVGGGRRSKKEKSRKPKCCICYNMEIDSLLYRCGHMCSCMKCAKELQWRGGKCPVCRAPIEDVVQASFTTTTHS